MADLNELQAAQTIKIAGSASNGTETNFVNASNNGELLASDILQTTVAQGTKSVSTASGPVELRVGASPLANRKSILIQAQGTNLVYGFSAGTQPFTIANGTTITLAVGPNIPVYVDRVSGAGSVTVAFAEFA